MHRNILSLFFALCFCVGCSSSYTPPYLDYTAEGFDPANIEEIEEFMEETAKKWNLKFDEVDRESSYTDSTSFLIVLYFNDDDVFHILSLYPEFLHIVAYTSEEMPIANLERLTEEVRMEMEQRFDLSFCTGNDAVIKKPNIPICPKGL